MTTEAPNLPKRLLKALIPVAIILALVVGGLMFVKSRVATNDGQQAGEDLTVGATLSDFSLHQFPKGELVRASSLKGKVMLINFWATWCEACVVEMPSIIKLREKFQPQGLEVLAVDMDENPEAVLPKALQEFGIGFPVYFDKDGRLSETFNVRAIPFTVIIDKNRKVLFTESGGRDWYNAEMQTMVKEWLAK